MIPFKRGVNPLSVEEETTLGMWWYDERITKKSLKKKPNWQWKGKYEILQAALLACNDDHCAYCDGHPLKDDRGFEIDHFIPKTVEPLKAFTYSNLFPSCNECNKKGNRYDPKFLKPDEEGYEFEQYFRYDSFTGEILPNESKPLENQKRAKVTLEQFKLNLGNKSLNRRKAIEKEIRLDTPINERPYRYGYF
jgi:uncharacterized protein (TIGR02646 family)